MAEVTAMRNNALPYPIYGAPFVIVYPFRDADGDLVTAASTPDAEISKNGDTFADCTNESTEIATGSGNWYLILTGTELTCDVATIQAKSATSGMKTAVATLYPRKLATVYSGTAASLGTVTSTIILDSGASAVDDYYNGMVCIATIDTLTEVRVISDYVGSTKTATVVPDWNVAPDNNDTFVIKLPEGAYFCQANVEAWNGTAVPAENTAGYPIVTIKDGTGTGEIDTTSGGVLVAAIANNAITAASIATDAIDSDALAASALTEIKTQAVDALATDTYAEPGQGAPAATATLAAKINYLYKAWRNKVTTTSSQYSLFADDAATVDQKATLSDDGSTYTRGEIATGP